MGLDLQVLLAWEPPGLRDLPVTQAPPGQQVRKELEGLLVQPDQRGRGQLARPDLLAQRG